MEDAPKKTRNRHILHMPMESMNESIRCQCDNVQNSIKCLVPGISYSQQTVYS